MYLRSFVLCLLFPLVIFGACRKPNGEDHAQEDKDGGNISDNEGWYLKKGEETGKNEKFFAIGAWSVPGYTPVNHNPGDRTDAELFKTQARNLNIVFVNYPSQKDYMSEDGRILMTTMPSQFLRTYLDNIPSVSNKGLENGYYRSQYLKKDVNGEKFQLALDADIKRHVNDRFPNVERAYLPIDEIALGLAGSHWFIPPVVGDEIYKRLKVFDPNAIVFVDLTGHGKGSSFFFEKRYLKSHSSMPTDPPYDAVLSESARTYAMEAKVKGEGMPLLVFNEGYNGAPGYEFKNNSYSHPSYTSESLKSLHYENIKLYAEAYKGNGNVFGINAFRDFYAHPVLAGVTVDAIRAGLSDSKTPIWLFFDGNGYAKPGSMAVDAYVKELKCQMYTSIIHGATGVFFWNDMSKSSEVWDALQPTLEEMKDNLELIKLNTIERNINDNMHVLIKKDEKGQKYIIASNTSKTDVIPLSMTNIEKKTLSPLEVYISPIY